MDQRATLEEKFRKSTLTSFSSLFSFTNITCGTFLVPFHYWGKIKKCILFYWSLMFCAWIDWTFLWINSVTVSPLSAASARFYYGLQISALIMKTLSLSLAVRNFTEWEREEGGQTQTASLFSSAEKTLPLSSNYGLCQATTRWTVSWARLKDSFPPTDTHTHTHTHTHTQNLH